VGISAHIHQKREGHRSIVGSELRQRERWLEDEIEEVEGTPENGRST